MLYEQDMNEEAYHNGYGVLQSPYSFLTNMLLFHSIMLPYHIISLSPYFSFTLLTPHALLISDSS
jgi:hypothetical protein